MIEIFVKPTKGRGVERGVTSSIFRGGVLAWCALLGIIVAASGGARLQGATLREVPAPVFAQGGTKSAPPAAPLDELAYRDGDRVRGHFLKKDGDVLVFKSERFGVLRVRADEAELILAKPPSPAVAEAVKKEEGSDVAVERWPFSPLAMAAALKEFFGSWHGRFAFAAEVMQDSSQHDSGTVEGHLQRKWTNDEVQLNGRYDYSSVDEITSTDMVKADGSWRHDFPHKLFSVYRPTLEWNRAFYRNGVPSDYVLLQQEMGAGINLFTTETRKLRVGLSENLFDTWVTTEQTHVSQNVESVFVEVEARLPWRIVLTDRGVYYYSVVDQTEGWENRFEINKKLTETLTIGVRHETRHNNPDVRSADYRRLRLLFGFDF